MNTRLARMFSALAVGGVAFSFTAAAQAATVTFASTVTFTESIVKLSFSSAGLNDTLTVGTPKTINDFITVTVDTGEWGPIVNSPLTASFSFTAPTPTGTTTDGGTISGGQVNGSGPSGNLSIVWPGQPVEFDFTNGTKLDVTLGDLSITCSGAGQNCLNGNSPYSIGATFLVLNGPDNGPPISGTPLPGALILMASGLGPLGFFGWRSRKRKSAA
jgi:hypothetical protein